MDYPLFDRPPAGAGVTEYDLAHAKQYLRLLDAAAEGADWREAATLVLGLDCVGSPDHARDVHHAHLERARWITREGYKDLLANPKGDTASLAAIDAVTMPQRQPAAILAILITRESS